MKTLFIEAKYTGKIDFSKIDAAKLPSKIGLTASVQFVCFLPQLKKALEEKGKIVFIAKSKQKHPGQVLGCDASAARIIKDKVSAFVYLGDGRFHPIAVAMETSKPVFCFNPITNVFKQLEEKDLAKYKKKKKGALLKFLTADNVGIIISTKPGQKTSLAELAKLKKLHPKKKFYKFLCNNLDINQLESFPFIQAWVNTACPRLDEDFVFANLGGLLCQEK